MFERGELFEIQPTELSGGKKENNISEETKNEKDTKKDKKDNK